MTTTEIQKNTYRRFDATATEQECRVCGTTKPLSKFYYAGYTRKDGVRPKQSICKACAIDKAYARQAAQIAANPPRRLNLDGKLDPDLVSFYMARRAREAARNRKLEKEAAARAEVRPSKLWHNPNLEPAR